MKSAAVLLAATLAQLAAGQSGVNVGQVTRAPVPVGTSPPRVARINYAAVTASLRSEVTPADAAATAPPARFRVKREPTSQSTSNPQPTPTEAPVPPPQDNNCNVQPVGAGPVPQPDTPEAFLALPAFSQAASGASAPVGYNQVFENLNAAYSSYPYITYSDLISYDPAACAAKCDAYKGCSSFNVYFERDPSLAPGRNCSNPTSTTNIRCVLWGSAIDANGATNNGQIREQFQSVIAGSNGYTKPGDAIDVPDYNPPEKCPNGAIGGKGAPWWLADHFFPGFFAPDLCKSFAEIQLEKNKAYAIMHELKQYFPINGYNAFELWNDGKMIGTYCKLYTERLPVDYCDYKGEIALEKLWEVKNAWFYTLTKQDFGELPFRR